MQWINTAKTYGWLTIVLHWLAAAGVLAMLYIGLCAGWAEDAHDMPQHRALMSLHFSLGMTLWLILAARIALHYLQQTPEPPAQPRPLNLLATIIQNLLLLAVALLIISGPLMLWTGRSLSITVWGVALPGPFSAPNRGLHEAAETVHAIGRYALYVLIPLHVLGALKHVMIDRDGVFRRMLWPRPLS